MRKFFTLLILVVVIIGIAKCVGAESERSTARAEEYRLKQIEKEEIANLTEEVIGLWNRISDFDKINIWEKFTVQEKALLISNMRKEDQENFWGHSRIYEAEELFGYLDDDARMTIWNMFLFTGEQMILWDMLDFTTQFDFYTNLGVIDRGVIEVNLSKPEVERLKSTHNVKRKYLYRYIPQRETLESIKSILNNYAGL